MAQLVPGGLEEPGDGGLELQALPGCIQPARGYSPLLRHIHYVVPYLRPPLYTALGGGNQGWLFPHPRQFDGRFGGV